MKWAGTWGVLAMLCIAAASCFSLDREAFTFIRYDLDVRIEPEQQRLAARGTIVLRNDSSAPQKNAVLQISSTLTWRAIRAGDQPLQFVSQPYESDIDHTGELSEAIVALPKEVPPGGSVELTIGYEGVIVLDATRLTRIGMPKERAIHSDWDQISKSFSAVRGVGYVAWYPVAMDAGDLSEGNTLFEVLGRWKKRALKSEVTIKVSVASDSGETPPTVLCNDIGLRMYSAMDRAQQVVAECPYSPLGFDVPSFAVGSYETLQHATTEIFYRPDHKSAAESFAKAADTVNPFVTEWFGTPREKAAVVELADPEAAPFESGAMLLSPLSDTDSKLLQIAMVHELAHAAFSSPRLWVYEGLAHFAQAVYRERQDGRQAALDFLGLHRTAVADAEEAVASQAKDHEQAAQATSESLATTSIEAFYRSKAAYVWWMLRDMVGEEALRKALAAYRVADDKDPAYFQRLLQKQSSHDLEWFFDDWVYRDRGLPDFRIAAVFPRRTLETNYVVTVTVENLGGAGAEVPVIVRFGTEEVTKRLRVDGHNKGVIRFDTPNTPTEVQVNDGSVPESNLSNNVYKVETTSR